MPTSSRRHWRGNPFPLCGVVRAPRPTSCAVTLRRGRRPRRPVSRGLILPCRGGRLCPPCMTVAPCRAGPMCPAAGYAFFGGARGPRPTGQVRYPPVGDGVSTSRQRGAAALGYGFPRQSADWLGMTALRAVWADRVPGGAHGPRPTGRYVEPRETGRRGRRPLQFLCGTSRRRPLRNGTSRTPSPTGFYPVISTRVPSLSSTQLS